MRAGGESSEVMEAKYYLGGCDQYNNATEKQRVVTRARCAAAKLLGECKGDKEEAITGWLLIIQHEHTPNSEIYIPLKSNHTVYILKKELIPLMYILKKI